METFLHYKNEVLRQQLHLLRNMIWFSKSILDLRHKDRGQKRCRKLLYPERVTVIWNAHHVFWHTVEHPERAITEGERGGLE